MNKVDKNPTNIEIYNGENVYLMGSSLCFCCPGCTHFSGKNICCRRFCWSDPWFHTNIGQNLATMYGELPI